MPDEAMEAPEQVQDTPSPDAPSVEAPQQDAPDTDSTNYEERYKSLQSEFTRKSQQLAEHEQILSALRSDDPDLRKQAAEYLGYEIEDDEDDDEFLDPSEARIAAIEKQQAQLAEQAQKQEQERQMSAYYDYVDERVDGIEKKLGYELSDDDVRNIVHQAEQLGLKQDLDEPDWDGAVKWFQTYQDHIINRYRETKKSQFVSPVGQAGSEKLEFKTDQDRQDYMERRIKELSDA